MFEKYLTTVSEEVARRLIIIRDAVQKEVPDATFTFSYGVPAFKLKKTIIMFAGFKHHIGIYPGAATIETFKRKLTNYELSKGTIRFPLDKPLPLELILEIVRFNVKKST